MKRVRSIPIPKEGQVKVAWARQPHHEPDVCIGWGVGVPKADANLILHALTSERMTLDFPSGKHRWDKSLVDELEVRGYDITTLKFSIQKKEQSQ